MAVEKVLIIDDEMYLGSTSQDHLARKIKSFLKPCGFEVEFTRKGEDALEIIKKDANKEIKLVLLDIRFTEVETTMQGPEIFKKIQDTRWDLPIVIITIKPVRKLPGEEDIFNELIELGASLFIEKQYLTRRGKEQIDYIISLVRRNDIKYTLKYKTDVDHKQMEILIIDVVRRDDEQEYSILKNPYSITGDMGIFVEQCIDDFPDFVHWKKVNSFRQTNFSDTGFHKAVHKLNDTIRRSSGGRIAALLERGGRTGCKLNVDKVEEME
jgi:FixJ family two-component response regulator